MTTTRFQGDRSNKWLLPLIAILLLIGAGLLWWYISSQNQNNQQQTANTNTSSSSVSQPSQPEDTPVNRIIGAPITNFDQLIGNASSSAYANRFVDLTNMKVDRVINNSLYFVRPNNTEQAADSAKTVLVRYTPASVPNQSELSTGQIHSLYGQLVSLPSTEQLQTVWQMNDVDTQQASQNQYYIEAVGITLSTTNNNSVSQSVNQ